MSGTVDNMALDIMRIAQDWSYWDRPIPDSVPRRVDLPKALTESRCLVIQGVRRAGKSTLLLQLIQRYKLDPARCVLLNLEDPRLSNVLSYPLLDQLVEQFRQRFPPNTRLFFFLDEIQAVEGWQKWVRTTIDRKQKNVLVITGSNATLLSGELSTALTGRHLTVELFPFDLGEFRDCKPDATLESYLREGGFPEALTTPDAERVLRQYFYDIVERDVRERLGARSSHPIRQVVQMAYEAAGSELSLRRIAAAAGIAVETAASYLDACEAAYLLFSVPYFAFSQRKRAARNRKYYPIDTGLRRIVVTPGGDDRGKSLECAVYLSLRRRSPLVSYWRGTGEVDFVLQDRKRIVPIQVTWGEPSARHEQALERTGPRSIL